MNCLSTIKDVIVAIAAIVAATVAVLGLKRWQKELYGKANFDVARGLARATYKLRDELTSCRVPFVSGGEFPAGYGATQGPVAEAQAWNHVFKNRWAPVSKALVEFESQALEAEALWGDEVRNLVRDLRGCAHTVYVAIEAFIEDKAAGGENFRADPPFGRLMRARVHASPGDTENALSNEIAGFVRDLEAKLRPHLARGK